jgi:hypothetical protein
LADANEKLAEAARKIDEIANSINGIRGASGFDSPVTTTPIP